MKHLLVVIVALLVPATAMAKGECKEDVLKFCKDAEHIATCLDEHEAELSEACKAKREAKTNEKKNEESAKMGKEDGTHTGPSQGATPENDTQKIDQPARKNIPSNEQTKP